MKNVLRILGVLLLLAGLAGLVVREYSYTKDTTAAKIGPVELTVKETETVRIPLWASLGAMGVGVLLLALGFRQR